LNALADPPVRTKQEFWHPIGTLAPQNCINRSRSLSIIFAEQVSVDAQRDVWLGVPEALADRDNIDARIDGLAGVGVPQGMKG
jgi:hypothetical protein